MFEALYHFYRFKGFNNPEQQDYLEKKDGQTSVNQWFQNKVNITFYGNPAYDRDLIKGKFYFRTAYRNEPDFTVTNLNKQNDPSKSIRFENLMKNDITVSENYQRLVAQTLAGVYDQENDNKTVEQLRDELIGKINFANILKSSTIIKFVDRDDKSTQEVQENSDKGIKTSGRRHIESYLIDL